MAFPTTVQDGIYYVNGLAQGAAPFPMGRLYYEVAGHQVGFDDSFGEPLVFKAVYEASPTALNGMDAYFAGYIQVMQMCFRGFPVPPSVYGGRLADRMPYVTNASGKYRFVDFMGPRDAALRLVPDTEVGDPFYAFNAMLTGGTFNTSADFAPHPLTNGSLYFARDNVSANQSRAVSITAEVSVGLKTKETITPWLTNDALVESVSATAQDLGQKEPYQIALDYLRGTGQPLQGLQNSDIGAELVPPYVLLTLPDPENERSVLCVSPPQPSIDGSSVVPVHRLWEDDLDSAQEDAAAQALINANDFLLDNGRVPDNATGGARGGGGLLRSPFALKTDEYLLELRYWTSVVLCLPPKSLRLGETGSNRLHLLSTITWSVLFQWDEDTRRLVRVGIRKPKKESSFSLTGVRTRFRQAVASATDTDTIDTSNFTLAAMRRDNFGASNKIGVVATV